MEDNMNVTNDEQRTIDSAVIEELKSSQSLIGAVLGGFLGAAVGAAIWAVITSVSGYQIGYMAVGVGLLTGLMVRKLGHGFQGHFGYIGAILSLLGCFTGNILAVLIMISTKYDIAFFDILRVLKVSIVVDIAKDTFDIMDVLFYAIAVYEGYRFSFITKDEINQKLNRIVNTRTM